MVTTFADRVAGLVGELLRSLWAELGVEGAPRRHDWQALDIEPLIIFTALFAGAALRAKTVDWCAANSRHLSLPRLQHFAERFGHVPGDLLRPYAEAVAEGARGERPVHGSAPPDLRRPSLIQLRLRALAGVCARAEVLRVLLAEPNQPKSAGSLAAPAGCGKEGLAEALEALTRAGIADAHREGRRTLYRLKRPTELAQALTNLPEAFPDWPAVFSVVTAILDYARSTAGKSNRARAEAAALTVEQATDHLSRIPHAARPPRVAGEQSVAAFERWAADFVADQAGANIRQATKREVTYTVHRLLLGGWMATVKEEGDEPRPLALSDDPELNEDRRSQRRLKPDDLGAAAEVVESILYDLRTRELQRRQGSVVPRDAVSDSSLPAMSREFAAELLSTTHKGQAATFSEEFVERWSANRRQGMTEAG
jgi:DNA-binding transcriptional ArsR family regulator